MESGKLPKKNLLSMQIDLSKFTPASDEDKQQVDIMRESTTFFRDGMRKLFKNPLAVASLAALLLIIIAIFVAPLVCPYGYDDMIEVNGVRDRTAKNLPPMTYSENEKAFIADARLPPCPHGQSRLARRACPLRRPDRAARSRSPPSVPSTIRAEWNRRRTSCASDQLIVSSCGWMTPTARTRDFSRWSPKSRVWTSRSAQ